MEAASLWAGVRFTARNGSPEALLTDAAGQGLHLYGISSLPGGFCAHCAAWQYRRLAALARPPGGCGCEWKNGWGFIFCASAAAAQGALGGACRLGAGAGLAARIYMGGGLRQPDHRAAGAGGCSAAQLRPAARHCRNRGAAALRRVCPAGKRRVLLGKPEF